MKEKGERIKDWEKRWGEETRESVCEKGGERGIYMSELEWGKVYLHIYIYSGFHH